MVAKKPGILCLEGDWSPIGLLDRSSVEPVRDLIQRLGYFDTVVHRDVATIEEFQHYLEGWLDRKAGQVLHRLLAFHGRSWAAQNRR